MSASPRERLIEAGIRLLERDGPQALQARKVAAEIGASTMAVYTHFGGMTGLLDAIAGEVFARFAQALTEIPRTDDPVADFFAMGASYRRFALANPQRYQLIFGISSPETIARRRTDLTVSGSVADGSARAASFEALLAVVRRMITAGRIRDDGELAVAGRLWSLIHGAVMLEIAGFFGHEGHGLTQILGPMTVDLLVGMGDDRAKTTASMLKAGDSHLRKPVNPCMLRGHRHIPDATDRGAARPGSSKIADP
ncbi:TetR/AcrR family transcriptional regulator [Mycobacterium sp. SM1]|uniref:TetR/AcrR family transcriptional regulator n=1 Tax=Mycobacterium sp. SM1 TaxID=2816243 RepID=UPI001BCD7DA6|nr:TetR/AcrR family transcriptional regulator [Mycobacterium sp. SM1]MBS4727887.1 TetR/AcrR family transcriptional regulator [Mycobacterium sp. SM1]